MKLRTNWPLYLLLLVFAVLGIRCAWILSNSTTGWQPHLREWTTLTTDPIGIETLPLSDQNPDIQAEFWLKQVAEIEAINHDPQVALGAAWMLDEPQSGFYQRYISANKHCTLLELPIGKREINIDKENIGKLKQEFETLCRDECLAKIETATRLAPDNLELWRVRALLLFHNKGSISDVDNFVPRRADWLSVLDECESHDPDNALYDYLAATQLKSMSSEDIFIKHHRTLKVTQPETYARAQKRFRSGLKKPFLKYGNIGYAASMSFLSHTSVPQIDQLDAAGSRRFSFFTLIHSREIFRWQKLQYNKEIERQNYNAAEVISHNIQSFIDQITENGNFEYLSNFKIHLQRAYLAILGKTQKHHLPALNQTETNRIAAAKADILLGITINNKVYERYNEKPKPKNWTGQLGAEFLIRTAQIFVVVSLGLALLAGFVGWIFGTANDSERIGMGWLRQTIAWLLGIGISFVLWGMCPAEIISSTLKTYFIWISFASLILAILLLIRKRFQIPMTQFAALSVSTALPIVIFFHFSVIIDLGYHAFISLPLMAVIILPPILAWLCWIAFRLLLVFVKNETLPGSRKFLTCGLVSLLAILSILNTTKLFAITSNEFALRAWFSPTMPTETVSFFNRPSSLQNVLNLNDSQWTWALIQWHIYEGLRIAILLTILILLSWYLIRRARRCEGGFRAMIRTQKRNLIRETGFLISKSFVVASITFSLFYLAATPSVVEDMDHNYLIEHERMANPDHILNEVKTITAEVKSDQAIMMKVRAEVAEINRQIAEQEKWSRE